jgi:hypothetical protein
MKALFFLAALAGALGTAVAPATSAGVRYVTVVNLLAAPATAVLHQYGPVGKDTIASKRDFTFDIPPGSTSIVVTSSACSGEKRLALPTQERVRAVINTGCALSVQ